VGFGELVATADSLGQATRSAVRKLIRVLVVDDQEDVRASLMSLLPLLGCIVRQAAVGEQALREAIEHQPDIALIDIGLPDIDGYEIARRIRELPSGKSITLVAVTGYGQPKDIQRSLEAGFDFHLTKPVEVEDIKALFTRVAGMVSAKKDSCSASSPAA
jgi:CheY-like chemotaxis protein